MMDKVAMYKDYIEKTAMALSKANYLNVKNNALNAAAEFNNIRKIDWEEAGKIFNQKHTTSKEGLDFYRKMKDSVPQGKTMELKHNLKKHLFYDSSVQRGLDDAVTNQERLMRNKGKISDADYQRFKTLRQQEQGPSSYNAYSNTMAVSPHIVDTTAHEMGHAATVSKPGKENLENVLFNRQQPHKGFDKEDSTEFVKYVNNAYRDGNKKSKQIGSRLVGAWHEALKNGNTNYLEELRANAKGYNSIHEHLGKEVADNTLDGNLGSIMSYTHGNRGTKAKRLWADVVDSPTRVGNKEISFKAGYYGMRDGRAITNRNKQMEETFKKR